MQAFINITYIMSEDAAKAVCWLHDANGELVTVDLEECQVKLWHPDDTVVPAIDKTSVTPEPNGSFIVDLQDVGVSPGLFSATNYFGTVRIKENGNNHTSGFAFTIVQP